MFVGVVPTAIRQASSVGVRFWLYPHVKKAIPGDGGMATAMLAGGTVGAISVILNNPVDTSASTLLCGCYLLALHSHLHTNTYATRCTACHFNSQEHSAGRPTWQERQRHWHDRVRADHLLGVGHLGLWVRLVSVRRLCRALSRLSLVVEPFSPLAQAACMHAHTHTHTHTHTHSRGLSARVPRVFCGQAVTFATYEQVASVLAKM